MIVLPELDFQPATASHDQRVAACMLRGCQHYASFIAELKLFVNLDRRAALPPLAWRSSRRSAAAEATKKCSVFLFAQQDLIAGKSRSFETFSLKS